MPQSPSTAAPSQGDSVFGPQTPPRGPRAASRPRWRALSARWTYAAGRPAEGLDASVAQAPPDREPVALPHRVLLPDTPLWYVADVCLPGPCALRIQADDGAHLYISGLRIPAEGYCFRIADVEAGTHRLVVRVLNKAMHGGLERLWVLPLAEYDRRRASPLPPTRGPIRPLVQLESATAVRISAETGANDGATLAYRIGHDGWQHAAMAPRNGMQSALLTDLAPGTRIRYRITDSALPDRDHAFELPPVGPAFGFAVWADSQDAWQNLRAHARAMRDLAPAFAVGLGDLVVDGYHARPWRRLCAALAPLATRTPIVLLGGNHDYDGCFDTMRSPWLERILGPTRAPWHAWTVANARFIALDPNVSFPTGVPAGSEQHAWLMREVASPAWRGADWRFILVHQPPYSQGWPEYEGDLPIRALLEPIIERDRVDFVVSGHTHDYERRCRRSGPHTTTFLVVGGGGAGLEEGPLQAEPAMDLVIRRHHFGYFRIDGQRAVFEARTADQAVIDRVVIDRSTL